MNDTEEIKRDNARTTGRTEGPFGSDDADADRPMEDNRNRLEQENSANGLDSRQVRGSQDGRNERGIASTDMDSKNGILRMGDTANSTMEVTNEGQDAAVANDKQTNTAMVDVTTHGPDDYASADKVPAPKAQKAAKKQNSSEKADRRDKEQQERNKDQQEHDASLAETGTDLNNKPPY